MSKQKKQKNFVADNQIQFRAIGQEQLKLEDDGLKTWEKHQDESQDQFWCLPFSIDDIEDFQTEQKMEGEEQD